MVDVGGGLCSVVDVMRLDDDDGTLNVTVEKQSCKFLLFLLILQFCFGGPLLFSDASYVV